MRTELLNYLQDLRLKTLNVSEELPFSNSGISMFLKNPKRIYLDLEQITTEPFIALFNSTNIDNEVHSVRLYFSTDAKQLPSDYSNIIAQIRAAKNVPTTEKFHRREVTSQTTFENDLMITEFEFKFTKLT